MRGAALQWGVQFQLSSVPTMQEIPFKNNIMYK